MAQILVVGAGAVGCYFGVLLQRAGNGVTFLARRGSDKVSNALGLRLDFGGASDEIALHITADPASARDAELILLCVKSNDTASAARELRPHLQAKARVVCLQNGVRNHAIFESESGHVALPAVVYVAAQMQTVAHLVVNAAGRLVLGSPRGRTEPLDDLLKLFQMAGVPCRISDFIERDLWKKLIINCAFNGISACTGAKYGAIMNSPACREVMEQVIRESVAVAHALDIPLEFDALRQATWKIGETMRDAISSTAQDIGRGKKTEIEFLNGEIVSAGKRLGIATPANQAIVALVELTESIR